MFFSHVKDPSFGLRGGTSVCKKSNVATAVEPHFDTQSDSQERKCNADRNGDDRVQHGDPLHFVGLKPVRISSQRESLAQYPASREEAALLNKIKTKR